MEPPLHVPKPDDGLDRGLLIGRGVRCHALFGTGHESLTDSRFRPSLFTWLLSQAAPAEGFADLAGEVFSSPAKNYLLSMLGMAFTLLFLMGLLCGRITKRVTQQLKDR